MRNGLRGFKGLVGIDVSEARLDVCLLPANERAAFDHDRRGIARRVAWLAQPATAAEGAAPAGRDRGCRGVSATGARAWWPHAIGETFPWGTLAVNLLSSLPIGLVAVLTGPDGRLLIGSGARQFVRVGVIGGFTTSAQSAGVPQLAAG